MKPRVRGKTYPCEHCGEPYVARRAKHYYCDRRPGGKLCRLWAWEKRHPRLSPPGTVRRRPSREHRKDLYLTAEQAAWLEERARRDGDSQSAVVREAIELMMKGEPR